MHSNTRNAGQIGRLRVIPHRPLTFHGISSGVVTIRPALTGQGRITGTTKIAGPPHTPTAQPVMLFTMAGQRVAETRSDDSGKYAFRNIALDRRYFVAAFDESGTYNAVIADNLLPERQP